MRRPSMVRRLIGWQVAAMLVAWVALSAWIVSQMMAYGNGDLDRRMNYLSQALAEAASAGRSDRAQLERRLLETERIFVRAVFAELGDDEPTYRPVYRVWSRDGQPLYDSAAAQGLDFAPGAPGLASVELDGHEYRTATVRSADAAVRVLVAERTDQRWAANWPMLRAIGSSQLMILAWCLAVTWIAARRGFRPLTTLASAIARRQLGDLTPLPLAQQPMETAPIVLAINELLQREERRLEAERGFLADAAHELRTPLAAIGAQSHLLAQLDDPVLVNTARQELQAGIDRVSHLLSQLLDIARLDAGSAQVRPEPVDVAQLCRQRLASLSRLARARAIEVELNAPDSLTVVTHRGGFQSVVDNLIDNAIRYTPSGGHVRVALSTDEEGLLFEVKDDGPGIAPADRERVLERFVRLPGSSESGSGLGLAIVQRVLRAQAGTLRFVEGLSGRGIGVAVRLPAAAA